MNQSIDKLANLLLVRKAINSLPANTSLTLRELNALIRDFRASNIAVTTTGSSVSSSPGTASSFSTTATTFTTPRTEYHHNHNHRSSPSTATTTTTTMSPSFLAVAAATAETTPPALRVSARRLSSVSNRKTERTDDDEEN